MIHTRWSAVFQTLYTRLPAGIFLIVAQIMLLAKFEINRFYSENVAAFVRETLIKAFPAPDLRHEVAKTVANPCASTGGTKEMLI